MKGRIISTVMIFLLLTGIASIALFTSPVYAATTLYIDPSTTTKHYSDVGNTFEVTVMLNEVVDFYGLDIQITWDESLITYFSELYVGNLQAIWGPIENTNWTVTTHANAAGSYRFIANALGPGNGYTGSHALLTVGFTIKDPLTNSKKTTPISFGIHKLSDSAAHAITHTATDGTYEIWGKTPTISFDITDKTCRKINETFQIAVSVSDAASVTSFTFDIRYDTLLLNYTDVIWGIWGSGSISNDEATGTLTGSTSGSAQDGTMTLLTIEFKAAYNHIWKDETTISGWQNIKTGAIFIQSTTLDYPISQPDLTYTRGGAENKITVGSDFTYTWSPIQGDIDLSGEVDITDLRTVAAFYDIVNDTWNLTGADGMIDIFDLVIVATNFGFEYSPP